MSGARYRRATKNHAVRVDHTDGSVTKGFVGAMMQAQHFMHFETDDGELTLMNVASIKRITSTEPDEEKDKPNGESEAQAARAKREAENARQREAEEAAQADQAKAKPGLGVSPKKIEFAAERLTEINNAYRVLVAAAKAA